MNAVRLLLGALRRRGTARPRAGMGVALAAALLAGCTYRGTIDQPITIKLTWYSYLAGEDIRQTCVDSPLPRYRLIYNGHYDEQIRSYEVVAKDDGGAHFKARVLGPMRAFAVIRDPLDLQDPWRWTVSEARLGPEGFAAFVSVLEDSGLWRPFGATGTAARLRRDRDRAQPAAAGRPGRPHVRYPAAGPQIRHRLLRVRGARRRRGPGRDGPAALARGSPASPGWAIFWPREKFFAVHKNLLDGSRF